MIALPAVAILFSPALLAATPPAAAARPRLAVIVTIDGLSFNRLEYYRSWYVGGLKRLLDEGHVETECRYRHLNTETGPGHSSLSTGAPPRVTGIVANRWFQRLPDGGVRAINSVDQAPPAVAPGSPPMFYREVARDGRLYVFAFEREAERFAVSGEVGRGTTRLDYGPKGETVVFDSDDAIMLFNLRNGRSHEEFFRPETVPGPGNLRVPTLGDRLVGAFPRARVVSLSAKDRSAIFLAGRTPAHAVYWFDQDAGRFVTSAAYDPAPAARTVVSSFNRSAGALLPARFGLAWKKLPMPEPPPSPMPASPSSLWDFQLPANGVGFDHPFTLQPRGYFASLYVSPMMDEVLNDLALAFVRDEPFGLGRGDQPDLLALSYSAQDVVAHSYGPDSEENLDVLRRLDVALGRLLQSLDAAYPKGSVLLALSADHGMPPIPEAERARDPAFKGGRLVNNPRALPTFDERLNRLLQDELCLPPDSRPIFGAEGWSLMYNRSGLPLRTVEGSCGPAGRLVTAETLDATLPSLVTRFWREEVAAVLPVSQRDRWSKDDPVTEFALNDLDLERSGDAFLVLRPNVLMHWDPARGTNHGSHYDYDTHVPLIFWGNGTRGRRSTAPSTPYDVAPTLAAALGLVLPDAVGKDRLGF